MKHIHFIGICGVAMNALAIAFRKAGWSVTGSDAGFFPPISTHLRENEIDFYPGWHPEKMTRDGEPDLVVVGNVASSTNAEWVYVQEHKLNYKSYPEVVAEYFIKPKSIVCAGTYGKTTTSALLSWILSQAGMRPSYMFGGLATPPFNSLSSRAKPQQTRGEVEGSRSASLHQEPVSSLSRDSSTRFGSVGMTNSSKGIDSAKISSGDWSVVEGDEYKSARWDMRPKFAHYSPTHLLLTSVIWDHADVYPTEQSYIQTFEHLVKSIPHGGLIVANTDDKAVAHLITLSPYHPITYGQQSGCAYRFEQLEQTKSGISFDLIHKNQSYHIQSPMLGDYQAANITGAFAMAHEIGIEPQKIINAIKTFAGLKRRLEKRFEGKVTVFDDIAHSPAKATATLATLRKIYSGKIIAIFEPNTGNRRPSSAPGYDHAFADADIVMIPALTHIKKNPENPEKILEGRDIRDIIGRTHPNAWNCTDDQELVEVIKNALSPGDVVVFLGSHSFRGMIEALIKEFPNFLIS